MLVYLTSHKSLTFNMLSSKIVASLPPHVHIISIGDIFMRDNRSEMTYIFQEKTSAPPIRYEPYHSFHTESA